MQHLSKLEQFLKKKKKKMKQLQQTRQKNEEKVKMIKSVFSKEKKPLFHAFSNSDSSSDEYAEGKNSNKLQRRKAVDDF